MSVTPKQKVRLDNFKALYNSIKGNIKIVNETLEAVIKKRDIAKEKTRKDLKDLVDYTSEFQQLQNRKSDIESGIDRREIKIKEKEVSISKKEKSSDEQIKLLLSIANKKKDTIDTEIRKIKEDIDSLSLKRIGAFEELAILAVKTDSLRSENKELSKNRSRDQKEFAQIEKSIREKEGKSNKELDLDAKKLKELKNQIASEQEKVGEANKSLANREKEIERKEKVIAILTRRLGELYEEVRPGINFKI